MKSKRKLSIIVTALTLAMLLLVGLTVAYLTDLRIVTNKLGIGTDKDGKQNVLVSLKEPAFENAAETGDKVYNLSKRPNEPTSVAVYNLKPGDKIFKDPQIKNDGSDSIYVRVKVLVDNAAFTKLKTDLGLEINADFFEENGYYYYGTNIGGVKKSTLLEKNSAAIDFFKIKGSDNTNLKERWTMEIPKSWTNDDVQEFSKYMENGAIKIPVRVEAIQTQNFGVGIPWKNDSGVELTATDIIPAVIP